MPTQQATLKSGFRVAIESIQNGTSQDLVVRTQVPDTFSFGAVGLGTQMQGAMIFVTYPAANGQGTTLSVRKGVGEVEPVPLNSQPCQTTRTSASNGIFDTAFTCPGLGDDSRLKGNTNSDWIFSLGPPSAHIASNSVDADLDYHGTNRGFFNVDMVQAETQLSAGGGGYVPSFTAGSGGDITTVIATSPQESYILAHAILLAGSFLVIFPLGVFLLRGHSTRLHYISQSLGFLLSVVGFIIALYMTASTTEFSSFSTSHQILGIVTVSLLFLQALMGFTHHGIYKQKQRSTWLSLPHINLGRIVIILGMVNGILGFLLYGDHKGAIGYGVASGVVILAVLAVGIWDMVRKSRQSKNASVRDFNGSSKVAA